MPDRQEHPDRLEREINEILSNIEKFPDADQRKRRARSRAMNDFTERLSQRQRSLMRGMSMMSLSQLMLLSFVIIVASMFFREVVRISWPWMMYAGVLLFLASFTLMMFGPRGSQAPRNPQYWRGREMSYTHASPRERFRRWWRNRSSGRR